MAFQIFKLSNFIKQDVYILHNIHRRSFSSMSQLSDELIRSTIFSLPKKRTSFVSK